MWVYLNLAFTRTRHVLTLCANRARSEIKVLRRDCAETADMRWRLKWNRRKLKSERWRHASDTEISARESAVSRRRNENTFPRLRDISRRISDIIFPVYFCNAPERNAPEESATRERSRSESLVTLDGPSTLSFSLSLSLCRSRF